MSRILIIIAVLPALILLGFIYMRDRKEKPPVKLMVLLLALGAGTIIPAAIAEFIGQLIVAQTDTDHQTMLLVLCFLVIGIVEELGKYLVTVCTTWKAENFSTAMMELFIWSVHRLALLYWKISYMLLQAESERASSGHLPLFHFIVR